MTAVALVVIVGVLGWLSLVAYRWRRDACDPDSYLRTHRAWGDGGSATWFPRKRKGAGKWDSGEKGSK